jgi:hypothetical protein
MAYILLETIRRLALQGTKLAQAYVSTLRLKLIKMGTVMLRNTRRIRFLLASSCPCQKLFFSSRSQTDFWITHFQDYAPSFAA